MNGYPTLTRRQELIGMISDDYKSLYNVRPRGYNWDEMTEAELETWHASICESLQEKMAYEQAEELAHEQAVKKAMSRTEWSLGEMFPLDIH